MFWLPRHSLLLNWPLRWSRRALPALNSASTATSIKQLRIAAKLLSESSIFLVGTHFGVTPEKLHDVLHGQLADSLATCDRCSC